MQFIDQVQIQVSSGSGGDGIVAWRREKFVPNGGPAGGDGGQGGDVVIQATHNLHTLLDFKYQTLYQAQNGERGRNKNMHGKSGKDCIIKVPCGTIIRDAETQHAIADLTEDGSQCIVAFGGRGGRGNARFATSRKQSPEFAEPGEPGIERTIGMELKLLADVGLVGLPNAGKSTLISVLSAAKPKIADYPFTTLVPNLGVVKKPSGDGFVMADIPGLIEGASQGAGLGHAFLRHVERTRLLLHLVDVSALADIEPRNAFELINQELQLYSASLAKKPQLVVLTKQDSTELSEEELDELAKDFSQQIEAMPNPSLGSPMVYIISAVTQQGLDPLKQRLFELIEALPPIDEVVEVVDDTKAFDRDDSAFEILQTEEGFEVEGGKLERLMRVTDLQNERAILRFTNICKAMGVFKALRAAGAQTGDIVKIGGAPFDYFEDNS